MFRWHTICAANSAQNLEVMINSYYKMNSFVIGEEVDKNLFDVIDTTSMKKVYLARYYNKKWQYGYYAPTKEKINRRNFL